MMNHSKMHWACCWKPMLGVVLWTLGMLALVLAWVSIWRQNLVFGLEPLAWFWNALVLGVLALGCKGHGCRGGHSCGSCEVSDKDAKDEKEM